MKIPSLQARRSGFFGRMVLVCAALMGIPEAAGAARRIQIEGPRHVRENSTAYYTCTLHTDEGTTENVTSSASWYADSWYATISGTGRLETTAVSADQWFRLTVSFRGHSESRDIKIRHKNS